MSLLTGSKLRLLVTGIVLNLFFILILTILCVVGLNKQYALETFSKEKGNAWKTSIPQLAKPLSFFFSIAGDSTSNPDGSTLELFENNAKLGPAHALHDDIRARGNGLYSYWGDTLYFSTSDNSNPANNGKNYHVTINLRPKHEYIVLCFTFLIITFIWLTKFARNVQTRSYPKYTEEGMSNMLINTLYSAFNLLCVFFKYPTNSIPQRSLRLVARLFCFGAIFAIGIMNFHNTSYGKWLISPDTHGYWNVKYSDSWYSMRSPGVAMFLDVLGQRDKIAHFAEGNWGSSQKLTVAFKQNEEADATLKKVTLMQILLFATAMAFLTLAVSSFLPPAFAMIVSLLSFFLTRVPRPEEMMADPLAASCLIIFCAFLLFFLSTKKIGYLCGASVIGVYGFLVKPVLIFMPGIAGLIIFYCIIKHRKKIKYVTILFFLGCALTAATAYFPFMLYIQSGNITVGQLSGLTQMMHALFLAEPDDAKLVKDDTARAIFIRAMEKAEGIKTESYFRDKESHPLTVAYHSCANVYGYQVFPAAYRDFLTVKPYFLRNSFPIAQEIAKPILQKHRWENFKLAASSFIGAFGAYEEVSTSPLLERLNKYSTSRFIFPLLFMLALMALFIGREGLKLPILLFMAMHILHIAASSYGHGILIRYVKISEWSFLFAGFLALYSVCVVLICRFFNMKTLSSKSAL